MSELLPGAPADVAAALERLKVDLTRPPPGTISRGWRLMGVWLGAGIARARATSMLSCC